MVALLTASSLFSTAQALTQAGVSGDGKSGVSCTLEGLLSPFNMSWCLVFFGERNTECNKEDIVGLVGRAFGNLVGGCGFHVLSDVALDGNGIAVA
ncbi:hypothetical protein CR513_14175, partial [Mucuna pruriens]